MAIDAPPLAHPPRLALTRCPQCGLPVEDPATIHWNGLDCVKALLAERDRLLHRSKGGMTVATPKTAADTLAQALRDTLISPNEADSNWEAANVVDGLFAIARALLAVAKAIEAQGAPKKED